MRNYFKDSEFQCKCGKCDIMPVMPSLRNILNKARAHFGKPITITSGWRCPAHNKAVGGAEYSYHQFGMAADIKIKDVTPEDAYEYFDAKFGGLGLIVYPTWLHIDVRRIAHRRKMI